MWSFELPDGDAAGLVGRIRRSLAEDGLDRYVRVELVGDELELRFVRMGTTELRFRLEPADGGLVARLARERVAPLHGPFRSSFAAHLEAAVARLGGRMLP